MLTKKYEISSPIFITGATSKIGRAIVLTLAKNRILVKMYTSSKKRFLAIKREAGEFDKYIIMSVSLDEGKDCQIWLTGKSRPAGRKLLQAIPKNVIVVNFSVPNPLGENNECPRKDLLVVDGGLLAYDPAVTDLHFTMRLKPGLTYACHAATAVHAHKRWTHHEVDNVNLKMLRPTWEAAQGLGFFLPAIPEMDLSQARDQRPFWKKLADMPASIVL